jgi:chromosome segregation ATPase
MKLQKDNAILKANAIKLESAVSEQKILIENQKKDFEAILTANKELNELMGKLKTDFAELDKRFNKKNRDIGLLAIEKTKVIERITNSAGDKAARCIEIASGSPLTEKEINATKKSEINAECPSIANPNYIPY